MERVSIDDCALRHTVTLEYQITNVSARDLFIYDPDPPYVQWCADETLAVILACPPVPENMEVEVIEHPPVYRLRAQESVQRRTVLNIPVTEDLAYEQVDLRRELGPRASHQVVVAVGYLEDSRAALADGYFRGRLVATPVAASGQQLVAWSDARELRVPVEPRTRPEPLLPRTPGLSLLQVSLQLHEQLSISYTVRNMSTVGIYVADPEDATLAPGEHDLLDVSCGFPDPHYAPPGVAEPDSVRTIYLAAGQARVFQRDIPLANHPRVERQVVSAGGTLHVGYWPTNVLGSTDRPGDVPAPARVIPLSLAATQQIVGCRDASLRVFLR